MEKRSDFRVGLGLALSIYTTSHTFMTANRHRAVVEILTDDILLEVFDWYRRTLLEQWTNTWKWVTLVHVCRRWRYIVFGSPRRLNLWLPCTYGTPVRRRLNCWPSLPIFIKYWANLEFRPPSSEDEDNLMAALEHPDRVRKLQLAVTSSQLEKIAERMQMAFFTGLTSLSLWLEKGTTTPTLPKSFLAGCASPRLRDISLVGVAFPELPQLLASAIGLVSLSLLDVPDAGYIPPDVMATCLSTLPHLRSLCINFHSPLPTHHNQGRNKRLEPSMALPSLTSFNFRGTSEYLEDLVAKIDAPRLSEVNISFINQLIFDVPHLSRFIRQMEVLKSAKVSEVESSPGNGVSITMTLDPDQNQNKDQNEDQDQSRLAVAAEGNATPPSNCSLGHPGHPGHLGHHNLSLRVTCTDLDWQISSIAQICHQTSLLSNIKNIDIRADGIRLSCSRKEDEGDMVGSVPWLDFFHTFPSVARLRICGELGPYVASALEGIAVDVETETIGKVLPELRILLFECSRKSASVERFVAARQLFSLPLVVVRHAAFPCVWDDEYL